MTDRIAGCLMGGVLGDALGALTEGESPGYIRKQFPTIEHYLGATTIDQGFGREWQAGRYTDDTRMTLDLARWLLQDPLFEGESLLEEFARSYRPARRYGSSTARILEQFPESRADWRSLATLMFPDGSYGNGSAMRVAPIGCYLHAATQSFPLLRDLAYTSSITTHRHPLAVQAAILQALAVRTVLRDQPLLPALEEHAPLIGALPYLEKLARIRELLARGASASAAAEVLGTGVDALNSVPTAWYCYLAHPDSYAGAVQTALSLGGDTDTIASMTGALAGAAHGMMGLPRQWFKFLQDPEVSPTALVDLARLLEQRGPLAALSFQRSRLPLRKSFTPVELELLQRGLQAQDMDDKWNIDFSHDILYFTRSWTGNCTYEVRLKEGAIEHALVCRDADQYKETSDSYDAQLLEFLIDNLLLGKSTPFPVQGEHRDLPRGAMQHHISGTGYSEREV